LCAVPFVLAAATDHTLDVCAVAIAVAFAIGTYGHVIQSRTLILGAIFAIAAICLYFVITGEAQTFS
jgi:MFS-type transporter involved in bile tolerance (Atg22 family)